MFLGGHIAKTIKLIKLKYNEQVVTVKYFQGK